MPTSRNLKEIDGGEGCPCESGKQYARYCQKRGLKWKIGAKGDIFLERSLSSQAVENLKELEERFVETFGRKPTSGDKMFQLSEKYIRRATLRSMRKAKIRPPLVYGYIKTGLIVADRKLLTGKDQQLWDAAIDEYYDLVKELGDFEPDQEGAIEDTLIEQLRRNHTIGGNFIDRHFNNYRHRKGASRDVESVAAFLTANFVRGILSVIVLAEGESSYDAYNILRSMYENYITLAYIYDDPSRAEAFTAQLGILLETHAYATNKKGVEVQSEIIELDTGRRISIPSRWEMARSLGPNQERLYQTLYRDLSSICHSDLIGLQHIFSEDGFDYLNPIASINTLSLAHFLCLIMFYMLRSSSPCASILKKDLRIAAHRSFFELTMLREIVTPLSGAEFPESFVTFIDEFAANDPDLGQLANSVVETKAMTVQGLL